MIDYNSIHQKPQINLESSNQELETENETYENTQPNLIDISQFKYQLKNMEEDHIVEEENLGKYNSCHIDQSINQIDDTSFLNITDQDNDGLIFNNSVP